MHLSHQALELIQAYSSAMYGRRRRVSHFWDSPEIMRKTKLTVPGADVTLKCLPHDKSARGELITELICLPLIKISPAP